MPTPKPVAHLSPEDICALQERVLHLESAVSASISILCTLVAPSLGPERFARYLGQMATALDEREAEDPRHPGMAALMRDMAARIESTHAAYLAAHTPPAH